MQRPYYQNIKLFSYVKGESGTCLWNENEQGQEKQTSGTMNYIAIFYMLSVVIKDRIHFRFSAVALCISY